MEFYHSYFIYKNIFSVLAQVPQRTEPKARVYVGFALAHVKTTGVKKKEMRWKGKRVSIRGHTAKLDTT